jgi:glycerophosphoryl diester phosphodiesterase
MLKPRKNHNQRCLLIGHRGYRSKFPENTVMSFLKAVECGADGVECDIQKTKDGHYIVFHDLVLDNLTDQKGNIPELTLFEIKKAKVKGLTPIPTLEEFLAVFPGDKFINIELKKDTLTPQDCLPIHLIIQKYFPAEQIMISSFFHPLLPFFKKHKYITGMLIGEEYKSKGFPALIRDYLFYGPTYLNLPINIFQYFSPKKAYFILNIIKIFKLKTAFWTVNTVEDWLLIKNYADILITDEVELLYSVMRR